MLWNTTTRDLIYNPGTWACDYTRGVVSEKSNIDKSLIHDEALKTLAMTDAELSAKILEPKPSREMARFRTDSYSNSAADQLRSVRTCVREILLLSPEKAGSTLKTLVTLYPLIAKSPLT